MGAPGKDLSRVAADRLLRSDRSGHYVLVLSEKTWAPGRRRPRTVKSRAAFDYMTNLVVILVCQLILS